MKILLTPLLCLCFIGCATNQQSSHHHSSVEWHHISGNDVQLLRSEPDRPFAVLGGSETRNGTMGNTRLWAATCEADAVIISTPSEEDFPTNNWQDRDAMMAKQPHIVAAAIKYTGEEPASAD